MAVGPGEPGDREAHLGHARKRSDVTGTEFAFGPAQEPEPKAVSGVHAADVTVSSSRPIVRRAADTEPQGRGPGGAWARLLEARVLALAATVALAAVLAVTGCTAAGSSSPRSNHTSAAAKVKPAANCAPSGCAVTRTSLSLPQSTVLYGASCSGMHGSWFLNAIEGGGGSQLRPNYRLQWSFPQGATTARPNGLIRIPHTKIAKVTLTLRGGKLTLHGVRKQDAPVTATGILIVKLSGPASSRSLTFIEKGLSWAEHRLGLVSPFDAGGHPLVVHVKHVKSLAGC
jgi:hypothetical protein